MVYRARPKNGTLTVTDGGERIVLIAWVWKHGDVSQDRGQSIANLALIFIETFALYKSLKFTNLFT